MLWLISYSKSPPGEFWYRQTDGIAKVFAPTPLIKELAGTVTAFRIANNLPRAVYTQSFEDIVLFTVDRLNGNPNYVYDVDKPAGDLIPQPGGGCSGCGAFSE